MKTTFFLLVLGLLFAVAYSLPFEKQDKPLEDYWATENDETALSEKEDDGYVKKDDYNKAKRENEGNDMAYTPLEIWYGELPEKADENKTYDLPTDQVPVCAKEVLVYLWATTWGGIFAPWLHRYYYEIWTEDGTTTKNGKTPTRYLQCMNVAANKDVSLNSANLWLPVFEGHGQVHVKLIDAEQWNNEKRESIAYRSKSTSNSRSKREDKPGKFSELFVLGYR